MQRTIFNTPVVTPLLRLLAGLLIKLHGWRVVCDRRALALKKYVLIGAPHTSNWDGYYFILAALKLGVIPHWLGKDKLFRFPLGPVMRWFGGISVDRSKTNNLVQATIDKFNERRSLIVVVPPEGTRGRGERWKTGFYHIARGAAVPVVCGFINFAKKEVGMEKVLEMGECLKAELERFRDYYADKVGKFPERYTPPA
ncbi:1-acyl-sn-glycerol-3-phosphate acyltransferase [Microbulbifer sp.]|uniref:1-acyl-sn-glycerol-3-phosphate acyltransferase n=1 Tax=Microbulbifer sp. TaxID=1908541 RepID=UPI003F3D8EE8